LIYPILESHGYTIVWEWFKKRGFLWTILKLKNCKKKRYW
jgi:hypothetical protein